MTEVKMRKESTLLPSADAEIEIRKGYQGSRRFYLDGITAKVRERVRFFLEENPKVQKPVRADWHIVRVDHIGARGINMTIEEFLVANKIPFKYISDPDTLFVSNANRCNQKLLVYEGAFSFEWDNTPFYIIRAPESVERIIWNYVACPFLNVLESFVTYMETYSPVDPDSRILAYQGKWLSSTEKIYQEIKDLTWDDLLLDEDMKRDIRSNIENFFQHGTELYKALGIPHKRGFLFAGEPGSGKSLTAKIIAAQIARPFIYVSNISSDRRSDNDVFTEIFEVARRYAPSVLCFEDLDSLLNSHTRTHFLQLMDGFEANEGVLTIATTNFPEKIDPALVNRPSRFDRKYAFGPPAQQYRLQYLTKRFAALESLGGAAENLENILQQAAKETDGFSVAMLQELVVSSAHNWLSTSEKERSWESVIIRAVMDTRDQMKKGDGAKLYKAMTGAKTMGFGK